MFAKKEVKESSVDFNNFDTLIGKNSSFDGVFKATGTIRIDGEFQGEVIVNGDVFIGETSKILGNIACSNLVVSGLVEGNVNVKDKIQITTTGRLLGDVSVKSFIVDEDAFFEGNCKMIDRKQIND